MCFFFYVHYYYPNLYILNKTEGASTQGAFIIGIDVQLLSVYNNKTFCTDLMFKPVSDFFLWHIPLTVTEGIYK